MKKIYISPSVLSADKSNMEGELLRCEKAGCDFIHFDVMDNVFVPNTSFNDDTFTRVRKSCSLPFEVHLMVADPFAYIHNYEYSNNDVIIIHYESIADKNELLRCLKEISLTHKCGLSIKPGTPCEAIDEYLPLLDYILIMSVEPGFGGQKFMPSALDKIAYFDKKRKGNHFMIEVDGGINAITGKQCLEKGCDILVSGSYLFKGDMKANLEAITCAK